MRLLIILVLFGIIASLGRALYLMATGNGDSAQMVKALTVRITLSVALFILLLVAWYLGFLEPHGSG